MTTQLRWPSTNQKLASRTFLVVGDGYISNPVTIAKSITLTEERVRFSKELIEKLFAEK